jgi:hypothetical protein
MSLPPGTFLLERIRPVAPAKRPVPAMRVEPFHTISERPSATCETQSGSPVPNTQRRCSLAKKRFACRLWLPRKSSAKTSSVSPGCGSRSTTVPSGAVRVTEVIFENALIVMFRPAA